VCFSKFCSLEFLHFAFQILIFNFNSKFYFINFLIYEFEIKKSLKNSEKKWKIIGRQFWQQKNTIIFVLIGN